MKLDIGGATASDGFIQTQLDECKAAGPLTAFVGTTIAARTEPYCFTSFFADTQNFVVTGTGTARIFVEGGDVVLGNKNHSEVNYDAAQPNSIKLQIYTHRKHREHVQPGEHRGRGLRTRTLPAAGSPRTPRRTSGGR